MFRKRLLTLLTASALLLAACGGSSTPTPAPPTAVPAPTETPAPANDDKAVAEPDAEEAEGAEEVATEEATVEAEAEAEGVEEEATVEAEAEVETEVEATATPTEEATEIITGTTAATDFTVTAMRSVAAVINQNWAPMATIAPDGSAIAYIEQTGRLGNRTRNLCIFTFSNANVLCYTAPDEYLGSPYALFWSPDSTAIAFTENPIQLGHESDIWLFRLGDQEFVNLTDDGITGAFSWSDVEINALDYMPMWNPNDGQLYFWRAGLPTGLPNLTLALYRIDPAGGEPELVRDITDEISAPFLHVNRESFFLDGPSALSPDGTQVAVLLQTISSDFARSQRGLWLIDLDDDAAPRLLAETADLQDVLPGSQNLPAEPQGLAWTADGGLVLAATSKDTHAPLVLLYYFDSAGAMTPVVDFSQAETLGDLFNITSDAGLPLRAYSPWTASLSPDGASLLMYNDLTGANGIFQATLPPDGEFPPLIFSGDSVSFERDPRSSVASNGLLIMYGLLFTLEPVE